jgi:hypothetical protein
MSRPGTPEIGMPEGMERDRLMALRSLRDCGVIRVAVGRVSRGYRILQKDGHLSAKAGRLGSGVADCRLTDAGSDLARRVLK